MKTLTRMLGLGLACLLIFYPHNAYRFRDQSHLVLLLCWLSWTIAISYRLRTAVVIPALLVTGYSAASIFAGSFTNYGDLAYTLDAGAAESLLWVCLVTTMMAFSSKVLRDVIYETYEWAILIGSVLILLQKQALLAVISVDAAMIAMVYPALLFRKREITSPFVDAVKILLPVIAIAMNGYGATGIFALAGVIVGYCLLHFNKRTLAYAGVLSVLLLGVGFLSQGPLLVNSSGRMQVWKIVFKWWKENPSPWLGTGLGTFQVLGLGVQVKAGLKYGFMYMHNEYLQILFEQGVIGLIATATVYFKTCTNAFKARSWLLMSLASTSVVMLTQSPFRITAMAVYVALIVRDALMIEHDKVVTPLYPGRS